MDISFILERREFEELLAFANARTLELCRIKRKLFPLNALIWLALGVGFASVFQFYEHAHAEDIWPISYAMIAFGVVVFLAIAAGAYQRKLFLRSAVADDGHMLMPQKVVLTERDLSYSTANSQQSYLWSAIIDLRVSDSMVCLFIDNSMALVIPKRALSGEGELEELLAYCNEKIRSSK